MEEILEKLDNLKQKLDQDKNIIQIKKLNKLLMEDKELLEKVKKYQITKDLTLKEEIYASSLFREYKDCEFEVNLLILKINSKLKEINSKGKCNL